ncbi:hypothetical protein LC612_43240 [Nostoc sp. CHAB 5834]|nr:hypothetical protein [Nostoc sp. CHAB 5834]
MLDQTLTLPEDPEERRSFTARLLADPNAWLADTPACIPDYKITKVDDLPPWRWN